ncbi:hypothetical protein NJB1907Z4_C48930 [Mycobacterium pseudoshottsii]|uniref:Uncharacterized protein n=1 Tax=Mycobacterium pseudoshottsii TaxID=265949 RepID=A0A9N7LW54_9MYCO|nr:hypothetical protein NJB1907Z4_C48930 [Mycobacterium pseudoshottsii]
MRALADTVGPVVEDNNPFGVVAVGFGRIVDDERQVQAVVVLEADMRVCSVGARIRDREPIGEVLVCADVGVRGLGAIHVVA